MLTKVGTYRGLVMTAAQRGAVSRKARGSELYVKP